MTQLSFVENIINEENNMENKADISLDDYKKRILDNYGMGIIHSLVSLPVTDGNWASAANNANIQELKEAEKILCFLNEHEKGHKSRLNGVQRKIKNRK